MSRLIARFNAFAVTALAALALSGPASAVPPAIGSASPHKPKIWQPADAPADALQWATLATTDSKEIQLPDGPWIVPEFSDEVKALDDQTVKVAGYMMPLENGDQQKHFLLMAYPPDCPFCMTAGPQYLIEIKTEEAIAFSYKPLLLEGTMQLLEQDETGMFYRISDAKLIKAG
jgi:hypothetical protein